MRWEFFIYQFTHSYCIPRGLTGESVKSYGEVMNIFGHYMRVEKKIEDPIKITALDFYDYLSYLKDKRGNGQNTIFKSSRVIKGFYDSMVSLDLMEPNRNPLKGIIKIKKGEERVRDVLTRKEMKRLLELPDEQTQVGVRDKALMLLLYSTGIRASECVGLKVKDVDLMSHQIKVFGKGQRERIVPLNREVVKYLKKYLRTKKSASDNSWFFTTRLKANITRKGLYDRIKKYIQMAKINKKIGPHNLRHTFATEMVGRKISLVTIQYLLGHRNISSTMRYLRINLSDIREAIEQHPINELSDVIDRFLPDVRLPYQLSRSGFK